MPYRMVKACCAFHFPATVCACTSKPLIDQRSCLCSIVVRRVAVQLFLEPCKAGSSPLQPIAVLLSTMPITILPLLSHLLQNRTTSRASAMAGLDLLCRLDSFQQILPCLASTCDPLHLHRCMVILRRGPFGPIILSIDDFNTRLRKARDRWPRHFSVVFACCPPSAPCSGNPGSAAHVHLPSRAGGSTRSGPPPGR